MHGNPDEWPTEPVSHDLPARHRDHRDPGDRERLAEHAPGWFERLRKQRDQ